MIVEILLFKYNIVFSEMIEEYLVLLDINVAEGDGLELLNEYRSTENVTPTIIITSFTNIERLLDACNDYLKKPF